MCHCKLLNFCTNVPVGIVPSLMDIFVPTPIKNQMRKVPRWTQSTYHLNFNNKSLKCIDT